MASGWGNGSCREGARRSSTTTPLGLGTPALRGEIVEQWFANLLPYNEAILRRLQRLLPGPGAVLDVARAIDGHAKNFSLFLLPGGNYRLSPLYDVLSAWPMIGKAAGQWPEQVQRRHLISTASRMGLGIEADALVANLVARTPEVIATVQQELLSGFPEPLARAILAGLQGSGVHVTPAWDLQEVPASLVTGQWRAIALADALVHSKLLKGYRRVVTYRHAHATSRRRYRCIFTARDSIQKTTQGKRALLKCRVSSLNREWQSIIHRGSLHRRPWNWLI